MCNLFAPLFHLNSLWPLPISMPYWSDFLGTVQEDYCERMSLIGKANTCDTQLRTMHFRKRILISYNIIFRPGKGV